VDQARENSWIKLLGNDKIERREVSFWGCTKPLVEEQLEMFEEGSSPESSAKVLFSVNSLQVVP